MNHCVQKVTAIWNGLQKSTTNSLHSMAGVAQSKRERHLNILEDFSVKKFNDRLETLSKRKDKGGHDVADEGLDDLDGLEHSLAWVEAHTSSKPQKWNVESLKKILNGPESALKHDLIILSEEYFKSKKLSLSELQEFARKLYLLIHPDQKPHFYDHLNVFSRKGPGDKKILTLRAMDFFGREIYRSLPKSSRQGSASFIAGRFYELGKGFLGWVFKGMVSLPNFALGSIRVSGPRHFPMDLADALMREGAGEKTVSLLVDKMSNRLLFDKALNALMTIGTATSLGGLFYQILEYSPDGSHRELKTFSRMEEIALFAVAELYTEKKIIEQKRESRESYDSRTRPELMDEALAHLRSLPKNDLTIAKDDLETYFDYEVRDLLQFNLPNKREPTTELDLLNLRDYLFNGGSAYISQTLGSSLSPEGPFSSLLFSRVHDLSLAQLEEIVIETNGVETFLDELVIKYVVDQLKMMEDIFLNLVESKDIHEDHKKRIGGSIFSFLDEARERFFTQALGFLEIKKSGSDDQFLESCYRMALEKIMITKAKEALVQALREEDSPQNSHAQERPQEMILSMLNKLEESIEALSLQRLEKMSREGDYSSLIQNYVHVQVPGE
ncbi:MAG: hypothetical protein OXB88_06960 [Bacteriovoracales bacterium]|nr:hypothetical protein [Bacteriovoracales bacterium]